MKLIYWKEMLVTDRDGDGYELTLDEVVEEYWGMLDDALIQDGRIVAWPSHFLYPDGVELEWDSHEGVVDWSGFEDALKEVRDCYDK